MRLCLFSTRGQFGWGQVPGDGRCFGACCCTFGPCTPGSICQRSSQAVPLVLSSFQRSPRRDKAESWQDAPRSSGPHHLCTPWRETSSQWRCSKTQPPPPRRCSTHSRVPFRWWSAPRCALRCRTTMPCCARCSHTRSPRSVKQPRSSDGHPASPLLPAPCSSSRSRPTTTPARSFSPTTPRVWTSSDQSTHRPHEMWPRCSVPCSFLRLARAVVRPAGPALLLHALLRSVEHRSPASRRVRFHRAYQANRRSSRA